MHRNQIQGNWNKVCEQIKLTWGKLSEDDLAMIDGQRDILTEFLRVRYGFELLVAENKVNQFEQSLHL